MRHRYGRDERNHLLETLRRLWVFAKVRPIPLNDLLIHRYAEIPRTVKLRNV